MKSKTVAAGDTINPKSKTQNPKFLRVAALPVVLRELRLLGRRRRTWGLRALVILLPAGVLWVQVMASSLDAERLGARLFATFAWMQLVLVALVTPALSADLITDEKDRRTLEVLFTTPLAGWEIVVGALAPRLWELTFLILGGLPVMMCVMLLGGVGADQAAWVLGLSLAAAAFGLSLGLAMSVLRAGSGRAITSAYGVLFLGWVLAPMVLELLQLWIGLGRRYGGTGDVVEAARTVNPFWALGDVLASRGRGPDPGPTILSLLAAAAGLCALATVRIRRAALAIRPAGARAVGPAHTARRTASAPPLTRPLGSGQPVAWLSETRYLGAMRWPWARPVMIAITALVAVPCGLWALFSRREEASIVVFGLGSIVWVVLALGAAIYGARSFAQDRISGALDLLMATALTERQIVWGRFLGFWRLAKPYLIIFLPCWWLPIFARIAIGDAQGEMFLRLIVVLPGLLGTVCFCLSFGMWVSRRAATQTRAVLTAVVGLFLWNLLKWMLIAAAARSSAMMSGFGEVLFMTLVYFGADAVAAAMLYSALVQGFRHPRRVRRAASKP